MIANPGTYSSRRGKYFVSAFFRAINASIGKISPSGGFTTETFTVSSSAGGDRSSLITQLLRANEGKNYRRLTIFILRTISIINFQRLLCLTKLYSVFSEFGK